MTNPSFYRFGAVLYAYDDVQVVEINSEQLPEGVIGVYHAMRTPDMIPVPSGAVKCTQREFMSLLALASVRLKEAFPELGTSFTVSS